MRPFAAFLLMFSLGTVQAQTAYESVNESTTILLERLVEVQPLYEEDPEKSTRTQQIASCHSPKTDQVETAQSVPPE